jgi:hypothetical protein
MMEEFTSSPQDVLSYALQRGQKIFSAHKPTD